MARLNREKRLPIGTVEMTPNKNRKLSRSSSSSKDECNLVLVIFASIPTYNVPKNTTSAAISLSEHSKQYSKHNLKKLMLHANHHHINIQLL